MEAVSGPQPSGARHERKKQEKSVKEPTAQTAAQAVTSATQGVGDGRKKKSQWGGKKRRSKNRQSSDGGPIAGVGPQADLTSSQVPVSMNTLKDEIVESDKSAVPIELSTSDELPIQTELPTTDMTDELAVKTDLSTIELKTNELPIQTNMSMIDVKIDEQLIQTELSTTDKTCELALPTELLKTDLIEKKQETGSLDIEVVETEQVPLQIELSKIEVGEQPQGKAETLEIAIDEISQPSLQAELLKVEGDKKGEQLLEKEELLSMLNAALEGNKSKKALSGILPNGVETNKRLSAQTELLKKTAASSGHSSLDAKASAKDVPAAVCNAGNAKQGPHKKNKKKKGKKPLLDEGKSTPVVKADSLQNGVALEQLSQVDDPPARTVEASEQPPVRLDLLKGTVAEEQQTPEALEAASGGTSEFSAEQSVLKFNKTAEIKSDLACVDLRSDVSTAECQAREAVDTADQLGSVAVGTDQVECAIALAPDAIPAIGESIKSAINHVPAIPAIGEGIESANQIECAINLVPAMPVIKDGIEGANQIECAKNHFPATPVIGEGSKGAVPKDFSGKQAGMNKKSRTNNKNSFRPVTETVYVVYADARPCMILDGDIKNMPKPSVPVEDNKVPKKDVNTKQITILKREVPIVTKTVPSIGNGPPMALPAASPQDSIGSKQPSLKMLPPIAECIPDQVKRTVAGNDAGLLQDLPQDSSGSQDPTFKVSSSSADVVANRVPEPDNGLPQDAAGSREESLQMPSPSAEGVAKEADQTGDNLPRDAGPVPPATAEGVSVPPATAEGVSVPPATAEGVSVPPATAEGVSVPPATAEGVSVQVAETVDCPGQSPSAPRQPSVKVAPAADEGVVQRAPGTGNDRQPEAAPQHMSFKMPDAAPEGATWESFRPGVNRGVELDEEGAKAIACYLRKKLFPSYVRGALTGEIEMCLHVLSDYPSLSETTRKYVTRKAMYLYLMFAKDVVFANHYIDYKDWLNGVKPLGIPREPLYGHNSANRNRQNSYHGGNNYNRVRGYPQSDSPLRGYASYNPLPPPPTNVNSFSPMGHGMIGCHVPPPGTFPEGSLRAFYPPHDAYFNRNQLGNGGSKGYHRKENRSRDGRGDGGQARGPGNKKAQGHNGIRPWFDSAAHGPGGDMNTVGSGAVVNSAVGNSTDGNVAVGNRGVSFVVSDGNAGGVAASGNAYGKNAAVGIVSATGNAAYGNGAGVTAAYGNEVCVTAIYGNTAGGVSAGGNAAYGNSAGGNGAGGTEVGGNGAVGTATGGNGAVGTATGGNGAVGTATGGNGAVGTTTDGNGAGRTAAGGNGGGGTEVCGTAAAGNVSIRDAAGGVGNIKECIQQHDAPISRL